MLIIKVIKKICRIKEFLVLLKKACLCDPAPAIVETHNHASLLEFQNPDQKWGWI